MCNYLHFFVGLCAYFVTQRLQNGAIICNFHGKYVHFVIQSLTVNHEPYNHKRKAPVAFRNAAGAGVIHTKLNSNKLIL